MKIKSGKYYYSLELKKYTARVWHRLCQGKKHIRIRKRFKSKYQPHLRSYIGFGEKGIVPAGRWIENAKERKRMRFPCRHANILYNGKIK